MKNQYTLLLLAALALPLPAAQIYFQNFESSTLNTLPANWSGAGTAVESTGGFSDSGLGAQHLRNVSDGFATSILSLTGLGAHTSLTLSFNLIVWDSMDGSDLFRIIADGVTILAPIEASNFGSGNPFTGPGTLLAGSSNVSQGLGFWHDQQRTITGLTFAHTASTLTLNFGYSSSLQGGSDESFGLDNVLLVDDVVPPTNGAAVPEPSTLALAGAALALLACKARRRS